MTIQFEAAGYRVLIKREGDRVEVTAQHIAPIPWPVPLPEGYRVAPPHPPMSLNPAGDDNGWRVSAGYASYRGWLRKRGILHREIHPDAETQVEELVRMAIAEAEIEITARDVRIKREYAESQRMAAKIENVAPLLVDDETRAAHASQWNPDGTRS